MGFKPGSDELTDLDVDSGTLSVDETNNRVGVGTTSPKTALTVEGTITLKEQADADSDTPAYGQIWVNTATPCELYFTDDAGTDTQLGTGGGSARTVAGDTDNGLITWVTSDNTFAAESNALFDGTELRIIGQVSGGTIRAEQSISCTGSLSASSAIFAGSGIQSYGAIKTSGSFSGSSAIFTGLVQGAGEVHVTGNLNAASLTASIALSGTNLYLPAPSGTLAGGDSYLGVDNTGKVILTTKPGGGSARTVAGDTDNGLITWVTSDNTFAAESTITYDGTTLAAELATFSGSRGIFTMDLQCYGDVKTSGSLVGANLGTTGAATSSLGMNAHADPTSLKSATGGGQVVTFGTEDGSDTLAAGKLMCLQDDGVWNYADADVVASSSALIGIALGTTTGNGILLQGFYHCASVQGSFVGGQPCYVSENAGDIDFTAPSSAGQVVRVVGYGTDVTNVIYFNPTGDWVELG